MALLNLCRHSDAKVTFSYASVSIRRTYKHDTEEEEIVPAKLHTVKGELNVNIKWKSGYLLYVIINKYPLIVSQFYAAFKKSYHF